MATENWTVDGDIASVDWARAKADLAADRFDNGRSADALRTSFERSAHVAFVRSGGDVVGMARLLSDGVCNAYLIDVWTRSTLRRRGIASALVNHLAHAVPGQHIGLPDRRRRRVLRDARLRRAAPVPEPGRRPLARQRGELRLTDADYVTPERVGPRHARASSAMTTVRNAFHQVMRELGLTTVFGNPGSTEEPFLTDLPADFDYVLGLQEASVVAMADGYSQQAHRPAFVQLHTSGGVGNALGNIASAWHNRTPLIVFAGQQDRRMLLLEPLLTNVRAVEFPQPYVKWSHEVARPQDAPAALLRAYAAAMQPPAGPVFLSVPMDDFDAEADPVPAVRSVSTALQASADGLRGAIDALGHAQSPAMVVGGAVSGRWDDVVRLAETLRCPVWAAPEEGRPGFPETHPQFQGAAPPAIAPLAETLTGHDLVLVVGAPVFRYYPYVPGDLLPPGTRLIQLTDDPAESARAPVGDSILTDPAAACAVLADRLAQADRPLPGPRTPPEPADAGDAVTAEFLFDAVQRCRPADSIVLQESLSNLPALHERIPIAVPDSFFAMSSGILGYALPAAVGVGLAQASEPAPRKVICLLGDGAAQYSIQALWTAAQRRLPILFVVLRNSEYAILKSFGRELDTPDIPGLDLPGIDTPSIAAGYGCSSSSVTDPAELDGALRAALARADGPHLLQVTIAPTVPPLV